MSDQREDWSRFTSYIVRKGKTESDERYTPEWVLDIALQVLGEIDLDPCADPRKRVPAAKHYTFAENGLEQGWSGKVFVNPPFSSSADWLRTLALYGTSGAVTEAVLLLPVMALSNKSAKLLMEKVASGFVILERKLAFLNADYEEMNVMSLFPCALVYVGDNLNHFLDVASDHGVASVIHKKDVGKRMVQCSYCGTTFAAKRKTAKFCSTTCRVEAHRKNQASPTTRASS